MKWYEKLKHVRESLNIPALEVEDLCNLGTQRLRLIELGNEPTLTEIIKLLDYYDIDFYDVFDFKEILK